MVSVSQKSRMFLQGAILLILMDGICWNKTSWRFQCSTKSPVQLFLNIFFKVNQRKKHLKTGSSSVFNIFVVLFYLAWCPLIGCRQTFRCFPAMFPVLCAISRIHATRFVFSFCSRQIHRWFSELHPQMTQAETIQNWNSHLFRHFVVRSQPSREPSLGQKHSCFQSPQR